MAKEYDIHDRIFKFVIRVLQFINKLPRNPTNLIIINQITRSVTSMGANSQEGDGALTNKDFIHCFTIVRKEGKETVYWLKLLGEINRSTKGVSDVIVAEGNEIVAIISRIILNASKKQ